MRNSEDHFTDEPTQVKGPNLLQFSNIKAQSNTKDYHAKGISCKDTSSDQMDIFLTGPTNFNQAHRNTYMYANMLIFFQFVLSVNSFIMRSINV